MNEANLPVEHPSADGAVPAGSWSDQRVLVLGLGLSGLAMARWCARLGAQVTVADTRSAPPQWPTLQAEHPAVEFVSGVFGADLLARAEWTLVTRSPGLPPEQLAPVAAWCAERGVRFWGELDLFAQALQELAQRSEWPYHPKVLAITGTNGKTTVTSLTGKLLERAGWRVAVAGNIGPTLLDVLHHALSQEVEANASEAAERAAEAAAHQDLTVETAGVMPVADEVDAPEAKEVISAEDVDISAEVTEPSAASDDSTTSGDVATDSADSEDDLPLITPPAPPLPEPPHLPQVWVLELSSFQLDQTHSGPWAVVPTAAAVLNLSEDHLDWHGSMTAYADAKRAVFGGQALMLLNRNDAQVMGYIPPLVTVKISGRNRQQSARPFMTFGGDLPSRAGDWGIESVNGMEWLVRALAVDETRKRGRHDTEEEIYLQRLMPVDALRIRGRHNAVNALSALALATSTGAPMAPMLHGLREYRGEPHRVEPIGIVNEVEYFDDSKGTNVGATLAAVQGLGAERRLVIILGGDGKGQDFAPLAPAVVRHARAAVFIGKDGPAIRAAIESHGAASLVMHNADTLPEAVRLCATESRMGDAVLLSPACASLDMFDNYGHRAQVFIDTVRELAADAGVDLEVGA
jgi:UDP-N-acetylmuramoylalanine--D-glutamate ligase